MVRINPNSHSQHAQQPPYSPETLKAYNQLLTDYKTIMNEAEKVKGLPQNPTNEEIAYQAYQKVKSLTKPIIADLHNLNNSLNAGQKKATSSQIPDLIDTFTKIQTEHLNRLVKEPHILTGMQNLYSQILAPQQQYFTLIQNELGLPQ